MDPKGSWMLSLGAAVVLVVAGVVIYSAQKSGGKLGVHPTPSPGVVQQLPPDQQPQVSLDFSSDSHYVTVNMTNLNADQLEYNLIYDATVKNNSQIQTGVNASANVLGKSSYTQKQLLGSESSGKFTYHEKIKNANMELTLRDASGRSIFTATYPFVVKAGGSVDLKPQN